MEVVMQVLYDQGMIGMPCLIVLNKKNAIWL